MHLIDTNVLSELPKKKPDQQVLDWFAAQQGLAISVITLEELVYGIERSAPELKDKLRPWLEHLLAIPPLVIPVDDKIAQAAGRLRAAREKAGRIVSQADMLIAATAASTGRILVTRNVKDFQDCGIALLNPFSQPSAPA